MSPGEAVTNIRRDGDRASIWTGLLGLSQHARVRVSLEQVTVPGRTEELCGTVGMRQRVVLMLLGASLAAVPALAQSNLPSGEPPAEPPVFQPLDPQDLFLPPTPRPAAELSQGSGTPSASSTARAGVPNGERQVLTESADGRTTPDLKRLMQEPFSTYRQAESSLSWLPAGGQDFGWFSYQNAPYLEQGVITGLTTGLAIHALDGPAVVPLPPRLYDFVLGIQRRDTLSDVVSYDVATSVGVYSDFEDSARDGVRFVSHAVGMLHVNPRMDVVLGVDYLDRDDLAVLPVAGLSWHDAAAANWRFDLVFPRPRMEYAVRDDLRMYLAGRLGGGTWDVEFPDETNTVMTYRDYRLVLGLEHVDDQGDFSAWELGYVFGRELELRDGLPGAAFSDALIIQLVWRQ